MKKKIIALATRDLKKVEISLERARNKPNVPTSEIEHLEELVILRKEILQKCEVNDD